MALFLTSNRKNKTIPDGKASAGWFRINKTEPGKKADVFIYDEISFWGLTAEDISRQINELDVEEINLRINSPGGLVFDGVAIYNLFKQHKARVNVYIDGLAASIASIIAMAGDRVFMADNAMIMIHKPLVLMAGNATELRKEADVLDQIEKTLIATYKKRVDLPDDELAALLEAETWIDSAAALDYGFADEVTDAREEAATAANKFNLNGFSHTPKNWGKQRETKTEDRRAFRRAEIAKLKLKRKHEDAERNARRTESVACQS